MTDASGAPLFTFGLITDTHIRPPGGDESSPFPVNDLANDRARLAAALIAEHAPAFTMHLGDMVHPLPSLPTYAAACGEAHDIFTPLKPDLNFVAGNHDAGDKPHVGSPAGPVTDETLAIYGEHFGASHYGFDHGDCRFLVINSSLVNSGTELEAAQRAWLEEDLAANSGKRLFLCSHYPPYIDHTTEPVHYDNYERPGRAWLIDLIERHKLEAVFSGHVHQFFFNRLGETRLYCFPSTSFIRQDFAELYRAGPSDQYGRNDTGKFSVALVDIYPQGHAFRVIPTDGLEMEAGADISSTGHDWSVPSPSREKSLPLVVHLRHAWAEAVDLPYNGPMEEFSRKRARNDYTLLRLWQMGLSKIRTPLGDLLDPAISKRVDDFHAAGMRFTFFDVGVPDAEASAAINAAAPMIDAIELISAEADMSDIADGVGAMADFGDLPVYVGKFHSSAHEPKRGSKFAHSVSFGFKWDDRDTMMAALTQAPFKDRIAGPVFQINLGDPLVERLKEIDALAASNGLRAGANIRLANENPAVANFDDALIADRVVEATEMAASLTNTVVQLDTFMDVDRGYNPRHGLIDRLSNFRPAGRRLAALAAKI